MYNKVKNYFLPATVNEASAMLAKPAAKAVILGGGTHLVKNMPSDANAIIDLRGAGLNYITANAKHLKIGAMATFEQVLASKVIKDWAGGLLWQAAHKVTPQTIRNMGTIGGNIAARFPYNSFPSVLLALDASVTYMEGSKKHTVKYSELDGALAKAGKKALIVEVLIPAATKKLKSDFVKFMKPQSARECYAVISTVLTKKGCTCNDLAVAVTSVSAKPFRFDALEKALNGQKITEEVIDNAIEAAAKGVAIQDVYKKEVFPVLIKRSILNAYNS